MKIFVLSNDPESGKEIIVFISKFKGARCVGFSSDLTELVLSIDSSDKADIVFIDKDLDENEIHKLNSFFKPSFRCVFVHRFGDLKTRFFEMNKQIEHITKPFQLPHFQNVLNRDHSDALENANPVMKSGYDDHFFIKCEKGKIRKIDVSDIIYVEASQNYIAIFQLSGSYLTNFTLNGIEKVLPADIFIRVHRSFIVNFNKIRAIESNRIIFDRDICVPVGQSYRKQVLNLFSSKILDISRMA